MGQEKGDQRYSLTPMVEDQFTQLLLKVML